MTDASGDISTRPYLIRALYEWCIDSGFTPFVAVVVNDRAQVPREYVKDGEIVLNLSIDATNSLKLGNDFIEFKARFAGSVREIMVPVSQVVAIYARENGQGMAFPLESPQDATKSSSLSTSLVSVPDGAAPASKAKRVQLASVESEPRSDETNVPPDPPRPSPAGPRPKLKRVK